MKKYKKNNLFNLRKLLILSTITTLLGIINTILHIIALSRESITINDTLLPITINLLFWIFAIITIIGFIKIKE